MPSLPDLYYRLAILNEIAGGKPLSQRRLAARLEVSLGQANKLLRGLEGEGLIRVDAEGEARYALTEEGRRSRMEAAAQFAAESRALLGPLRAQMAREAAKLRSTGCRKALLCAGEALADEAAAALMRAGVKLAGVMLRDAPDCPEASSVSHASRGKACLAPTMERRMVCGIPVLDAAGCRKAAFGAAVAVTPQDADALRQCLGRRRAVTLLLTTKEGSPHG